MRKAFGRLDSLPQRKAGYIEPMECLAVAQLPESSDWVWEIKLDGYRAVAVKSAQELDLFSRNEKYLNRKFPYIVEALGDLPLGTVVDGEIVALDDKGRPTFSLLQNFSKDSSRICYYIFDLLCCQGRDLTGLPLVERRALLKKLVQITNTRIKIADYIEASASTVLSAIRDQKLEGIVGKRRDSIYEVGKRSGAWIKHRVNLGQEFVIGGYMPGPHGLDSIIVGYYKGKGLFYVARTRNGFIPASRRALFQRLQPLVTKKCPFVNLPEGDRSHWGEPLDAEKMTKCVWVRPERVAQIKFLEWTDQDHLRHSKFVGLRDDKDPRKVVKEDNS